MGPVTDLVSCRSDSEYAERPTSFCWQGERLEVLEVLARWRTPEGKWFRVRVQNEQVFELCYDQVGDAWNIFQRQFLKDI
jgi:hypothetical protein